MFLDLSEDNLGELLAENSLVMVQYGATWCGNCKITKPKFKKLPNSRKFANVSNLPTFAAFKNEKLVNEAQGNKIETIQAVLDALTTH